MKTNRRLPDPIYRNYNEDYGTFVITYLNIAFNSMTDTEINKVIDFIQNYKKQIGADNYGKLKNN